MVKLEGTVERLVLLDNPVVPDCELCVASTLADEEPKQFPIPKVPKRWTSS
uniref:Protein kinase APK1A n=1 Tax=Rhizophora mucronata TaxID=61149 RepID=A0A2P2KVQ0_RHIMU